MMEQLLATRAAPRAAPVASPCLPTCLPAYVLVTKLPWALQVTFSTLSSQGWVALAFTGVRHAGFACPPSFSSAPILAVAVFRVAQRDRGCGGTPPCVGFCISPHMLPCATQAWPSC